MAKAKTQRKPKVRPQLELAEVEIERAAQHVESAIKVVEDDDDEFMTEKEMERQEEQAEFESAIEQASEASGGDAEGEEPEEKHSIVKPKFKDKYIQNARALGVAGKAAKRSNWDWLSQQIAQACLDEKGKINIDRFMDILEANDVDYSKWQNRNKGWEGRFRMTGRVALQRIVANNNVLHGIGGDQVPPPEWVEKYKTRT